MEELIKRLERVIQTGAPDKDGMHPISAETVLEVVKQLSEHGTNLAEVGTDCISRQAAINALKRKQDDGKGDLSRFYNTIIQHDIEAIKQLPPIQPNLLQPWEVLVAQAVLPQPEIGYDDCSNALLKMWMDNVLTDGDYYRIADKLNKKWGKTEVPEPYKGVTE